MGLMSVYGDYCLGRKQVNTGAPNAVAIPANLAHAVVNSLVCTECGRGLAWRSLCCTLTVCLLVEIDQANQIHNTKLMV